MASLSSLSGIHGQTLDITVVSARKLKNTELPWLSRQDPFVLIEYGSTKNRTRTCTDGGKNPNFGDKFSITLIEGLHELRVSVWNSNTITRNDFIGSGSVQLNKVVCCGFDDGPVSILTTTGSYSGEVKLIMHFPQALKRNEARPPQFNYPGTYAPPPYTFTPQYAYAQPSMYTPPSMYMSPPSMYSPPSPLQPYPYPPSMSPCHHHYQPSAPSAQYNPPPPQVNFPQTYPSASAPSYPPISPPDYPASEAPSRTCSCRMESGRWSHMNP